MTRLNGCRMRMVLAGIVATIVFGSGSAKADFIFGTPTNVGPSINTSANDWAPCISADGLSLYFTSARPGGYGGTYMGFDIWVATRESTEDDWSTAVNVGLPVNSAVDETQPCISSDGLSLFFDSYNRTGGMGGTDLWVATRAAVYDPWSEPVNLGPTVNTSSNDNAPSIPADGLSLFFQSARAGVVGVVDLWVTTRPTRNDSWGEPMNLGPTVNSSSFDGFPDISADGMALFFMSERPDGFGGRDLWLSRRRTTNESWGIPINLGPTVNTSAIEFSPDISADGHMLYFVSDRPGGFGSWDLWQAPVLPIVDLNADGIVDALDMCIMVDHWGTDEKLCDIGPMPWGDGTVDVQDLIVLSEHLFEEVNDPTLIAHWPLDEAQGIVAYESVAHCDGVLFGDPVWQADGGMVDGALQFDGIDDYVSTDPVLNPADSVFSVVVWVMGSVPGQIVLSQAGRANWLCTDSVEGYLMTELEGSGRPSSGPLLSEVKITDGTWHRIGLVWDGSYRYLYVDRAEVAKDAAPLSSLEDAYGGLYFGVGSTLAPGTFFSGLIDDIRIYNRAIKP